MGCIICSVSMGRRCRSCEVSGHPFTRISVSVVTPEIFQPRGNSQNYLMAGGIGLRRDRPAAVDHCSEGGWLVMRVPAIPEPATRVTSSEIWPC
jgi:hypothetical protein